MPIATTFMTAAVIVSQFLANVESNPDLTAHMQAADGDIAQIVVIAKSAGFEITEAQFVQGSEALTQNLPSINYGHPTVYFS
ncbi:MAG: hypothetical protein RL748_492 [Pseudomonadota bacterium]|jgi:predicted ribosomally synthesized peptide with nif11-like leader